MSSQPPPFSGSALSAVIAVLVALATYAGMDAAMKALAIALGTFNALFWRLIIALCIITPVYFHFRRAKPSRDARKVHWQRGILLAAMAYLFILGISLLPLAEAIALSFIAPLIALYMAALFLGEDIQPRSIIASLVGLAGVVVIAAGRLTGHYDQDDLIGLIAILVSALLYAGNLVIQRRQALLADPMEIGFFQTLIMAICYASAAPVLAQWPPMELLPLLILAALLAILSTVIMAWGYARAEAQLLINLEYSAFIWAALFGWVFFAEPVGWSTLIGAALIVAGCLLISRRQRQSRQSETPII